MRTKFTPRNRGAVALDHCGMAGDELAAKLGKSPALISRWKRGHLPPALKWRGVLQKMFGIDPAWWFEPCDETKPQQGVVDQLRVKFPPREEPAPAPATLDEGPADATTLALDLIKVGRRFMADIETNPLITPTEKARTLSQAAGAIAKAARITGEGMNLTPAIVLKSSAWRTLARTVVTTLEPWPDAMRALAEALKKVSES